MAEIPYIGLTLCCTSFESRIFSMEGLSRTPLGKPPNIVPCPKHAATHQLQLLGPGNMAEKTVLPLLHEPLKRLRAHACVVTRIQMPPLQDLHS